MRRPFGKPRSFRASPWHVLGAALTAQVGISVIDQGIPTLTGFIKSDLGVSAAVAGLTVSCFTLGRMIASYAAGLVADRLGERKVLVAGGLATGALVALAAALPIAALLVLLVVAGIASAASTPAGGRLVLLAFPRQRHGIALGIRQTGIPIGGLVAAALLPWVAHLAGWRWGLAAGGAVAALCTLPLLAARPERREPAVDLRPEGWSPARDRDIRLLTLWGCMIISGQYALVAFLALDLHDGAGLSLATASLLVAVAQAAGVAGRITWGALSDRALARGRKPLLLVLTSVGLVADLLLFATPRSSPIGVLVVIAALTGLALIGFQGLLITMIAELAGPARVGAATGFAVTFATVAITISPPLYGLVADVADSYRAIWGVLAVVLALAFVPAALVRERAPAMADDALA